MSASNPPTTLRQNVNFKFHLLSLNLTGLLGFEAVGQSAHAEEGPIEDAARVGPMSFGGGLRLRELLQKGSIAPAQD